MVSNADFEKAAEDSRKLTKRPNADELLELYGLYKVGRDEDINEATAPGMFDLKGKAKHKAWKKVLEEDKLSPEQAREKYVQLVEKLKVLYEYDENKVPEKTGSD